MPEAQGKRRLQRQDLHLRQGRREEGLEQGRAGKDPSRNEADPNSSRQHLPRAPSNPGAAAAAAGGVGNASV